MVLYFKAFFQIKSIKIRMTDSRSGDKQLEALTADNLFIIK